MQIHPIANGLCNDIGVFASVDFARCMSEYIPNGFTLAIRGGTAFDLECGVGCAEKKVGRELRLGHRYPTSDLLRNSIERLMAMLLDSFGVSITGSRLSVRKARLYFPETEAFVLESTPRR